MHNPWRKLWIQAVGRKPTKVAGKETPWQPTSWDRLCSCHFSNPPNPKSRRQDAKWIVPDLFVNNALEHEPSELAKSSSASSISSALAEITETRSGIPELMGSAESRPTSKPLKRKSATIQNPQTHTLAEILTAPSRVPIQQYSSSQSRERPSINDRASKVSLQLLGSSGTCNLPLFKQAARGDVGVAKPLTDPDKHSHLLDAIRGEVVALCRSFLDFDDELQIEGLVGITLDKKNVMLLNLRENIQAEEVSSAYEESCDPHDCHQPFVQVEPEAPDEEMMQEGNLQDQIQAAESQDVISSLSSRIVEMVHPKFARLSRPPKEPTPPSDSSGSSRYVKDVTGSHEHFDPALRS
jgi:hypothetical protein